MNVIEFIPLYRKALIIVALIALAGCANGRQFYEPPHNATIPASLKQACPKASDIPARDLSAQDIARIWAKDRTALADCRIRHDSLAKAVSELEGQQ